MTAPPDTYYKMLSGRLPGHGQDEAALKSRGILLDGSLNLSSASAITKTALAKGTLRRYLSL